MILTHTTPWQTLLIYLANATMLSPKFLEHVKHLCRCCYTEDQNKCECECFWTEVLSALRSHCHIPNHCKIQAIQNLPTPKNITQGCSFLGIQLAHDAVLMPSPVLTLEWSEIHSLVPTEHILRMIELAHQQTSSSSISWSFSDQ